MPREHAPGAATAGTSPNTSTRLAEEVALLKRAQQSLRSEDYLVALAQLRELDERFPDGALLQEREAARILAFCATDLTGKSAQRARAFLRSHPGSFYAARIRAACKPTGQAHEDAKDSSEP